MVILASQPLLCENKKKIQQQNVTEVSIEPETSAIWIFKIEVVQEQKTI